MFKKLAFIFASLLLFRGVASAQDVNEETPACTDPEIVTIFTLVSDSNVLDDVAAINDRIINAQPSDMVAITADLDYYQVKWWADVVPDFPPCAFAHEMEITVGRYLDEMLFATAMTHIAYVASEQGSAMTSSLYVEIAGRHVDAFVALSQEVSDLTAVLTEASP